MNFYQISTLLAEGGGIGLNTDILETGVLNILALIVILFLFAKENLFPSLEQRKNNIVSNVESAESNLKTARENLMETKNLLNQVHLVIDEIKQETITTKEAFLKNNVSEAKTDLKTRFGRASAVLSLKERQTILEIKQQIISLVLKRLVVRTKQTFETKNSAVTFLNDTINKLQTLEGMSL
jgi:F-type H+-transporting ATPase subunit b